MKTPSLDQLKSLAKDRAKAHSTYLKKLSKKPPKD
ncbi:MAG: zinc/iron-chelating domain-containing protein, partial [Bacteroidetes bacterium]